MKEGAMILISVALLVIIAFAIVSQNSNITKEDSPVVSAEATLSDKLEFPAGYHLADAYSYAFQYTGPYVVYICQSDDDPRDYRICTPKVTKAGT